MGGSLLPESSTPQGTSVIILRTTERVKLSRNLFRSAGLVGCCHQNRYHETIRLDAKHNTHNYEMQCVDASTGTDREEPLCDSIS